MSSPPRLAAPALIALIALIVQAIAAQQPPTSPAALVEQGRAALESGELATAGELFERALETAPEMAAAWLGASLVAERRGDPAGALGLARRAAAAAPEEAAAHLAIGRLLALLGRTDAALAALAEARRRAPGETLPYQLAALLLRDGGRAEEAMVLLEEALTATETPPAAISQELAGLHLTAGEPGQALRVVDEALERFPDRAELHLMRGLALSAKTGEADTGPVSALEPALAAFEKALQLGLEEPVRAHRALAETLLALDRPSEAVDHLERAAALAPRDPRIHYRLGLARQRADDLEGARAALERFRELSDEADRADRQAKKRGAALNEAQAMVDAGRLEDALSALDALLAEEPGAVRALNLRAKILFSLGRKQAALAAASRARAAGPGAVESHMLAGMFLMDAGRKREAEEALLEVVSLAPGTADAHALLGSLAADGERPAEAAERFARALALGADGVALRLRYAEVLHALGRVDESKVQLEAYRALLENAAAARSGGEPG